MRNYSGNVLTRIAMELLSLTLVRTGEVKSTRHRMADKRYRKLVGCQGGGKSGMNEREALTVNSQQ